jgi:hypothetical protein
MTELQVTINNLKELIIAAEFGLEKLEKAQKDLETPSQHKWEHGDVFSNCKTSTMICIRDIAASTKPIRVFCLSGIGCDFGHLPEDFLKDGKFLFNIKEKL